MFDKEPKSELARYAFGYTDKKPSLSFWIITAGMTLYVVAKMLSAYLTDWR
jgi:hypothetical protein